MIRFSWNYKNLGINYYCSVSLETDSISWQKPFFNSRRKNWTKWNGGSKCTYSAVEVFVSFSRKNKRTSKTRSQVEIGGERETRDYYATTLVTDLVRILWDISNLKPFYELSLLFWRHARLQHKFFSQLVQHSGENVLPVGLKEAASIPWILGNAKFR